MHPVSDTLNANCTVILSPFSWGYVCTQLDPVSDTFNANCTVILSPFSRLSICSLVKDVLFLWSLRFRCSLAWSAPSASVSGGAPSLLPVLLSSLSSASATVTVTGRDITGKRPLKHGRNCDLSMHEAKGTRHYDLTMHEATSTRHCDLSMHETTGTRHSDLSMHESTEQRHCDLSMH